MKAKRGLIKPRTEHIRGVEDNGPTISKEIKDPCEDKTAKMCWWSTSRLLMIANMLCGGPPALVPSFPGIHSGARDPLKPKTLTESQK